MSYMNPTKNILDKHMRAGVHTFLRQTVMQEPGSMLIDELCFSAGRKEGRIDVCVVNSHLHCYELKSDGDTNGLARLSKIQIRLYSQLMDYLSVIITPKYLASVKRRLPQFWGIYIYERGVVQPEKFPTLNDKLIDARVVAGLLWKDSALQLLSDSGLEKGFARKAKGYMHDHIAAQIDFPIIHEAVRRQLKSHRRSV